MAFLFQEYRQYMLEKAMETLVAPGNKNDDDDSSKKTHTTDILNYVKLLFENVTSDASSIFNLTALHSQLDQKLNVFS